MPQVNSQLEYSKVRSAQIGDVTGILRLLNHYAAQGDLLPRTRQDVEENLKHFKVISMGSEIVACGSLEHFTPELAEIRSLMVATQIKGGGLGRQIVEKLISTALARQVGRVMALTYVPEFFQKFGFKTVNKDIFIFPEKIWGICVNCYKFHNCDEIAVLLELESPLTE